MKRDRRWLQFSLRSFLVLLTALAVWLGIVVNRVREQREAVKAIEALGGYVGYDSPPSGLDWLRQIIGNGFFTEVVFVRFMPSADQTVPAPTDQDVLKAIPLLLRFPQLRHLHVWGSVSLQTCDELKSTLPRCNVRRVVFMG